MSRAIGMKRVKTARSTGIGAEPPEGMNLSEEEMAQYMKATGRGNGQINSDEGKVSQKVHEDTVNRLKEQISDLVEKNETLRKEKADLRKQYDDYKDRFENKLKELEEAEESIDRLKAVNSELRDENTDLRNRLEAAKKERPAPVDDGEMRRLRARVSDLERELKAAKTESEDLKEKLDASEKLAEGLSRQLEEQAKVARPAERSPSKVGTVVRSSPTTLESVLFMEGRYTVWLSRDGHTMRISPDVEGRAICTDGAISLPRLQLLIPFEGVREYDVYSEDGTRFGIFL